MSTDAPAKRQKHPRPSVVTLSCVFVAVTAFLTLTELVSALMDWGTVEMQTALQPALRQLDAAGVDWTSAQLLAWLRWMALLMVPFAVAAMVYAVYALRGDRRARVVTSVLAVVAGFASLPLGVFGILQATMLFLAAGALWSPEARRWYRGEPAAPARTELAAPLVEVGAEPSSAPLAEGGAEPPPPPAAAPGGAPVGPASALVRPTSVMTAGLLTIFGSLAAAGFASLYLVIYSFARADYVDAVKSGPFGDMITAKELELMMSVTFWASIGILPLALAGLLGAAALLARRRVGRTATLCWAWVTAALGVLMLPVGLLATAGAGAVIVLLFRDDARQWTAPR